MAVIEDITQTGSAMDAPADIAPITSERPSRALAGLLLLALWIGWAAPALWYQNGHSPVPLCVAPTDRR